MGKRHDNPIEKLRRETNRIILEYFQGKMISQMIDQQEDEKKPELPYVVEESLNNPYMNRQEVPLAMDIFKPRTEKGTELPVIVVIHGGGLVMGDRKISRRFCRILAGHGYLVFSVEYRLAPRANCADQLDDVCAGMDLIGRRLIHYDVDFSRIFLVAESAGAYLATYVTAMRGSEKLQKAIGYKPSNMIFKAVGLVSGMFYTGKRDLIGLLLSDQFYGDKRNNKAFLKYMDPENPEILDNLPPAFLVTSRNDFLNNYTLMFHDALKKEGKRTHLLYYSDKDLYHAFVFSNPTHEKSEDAINKMLAWFDAEADIALKKAEEEDREKKAAKERVKTGAAAVASEKKPAAKRTRTTPKTPAKGRGRKKAEPEKAESVQSENLT
jgi:acetyl esterase/lipase